MKEITTTLTCDRCGGETRGHHHEVDTNVNMLYYTRSRDAIGTMMSYKKDICDGCVKILDTLWKEFMENK